jgi:hypothetical protein
MTAYLSGPSVQSVIDAVESAGVKVPKGADGKIGNPWRDALVQDVSWAYTAWACLPDWTSDSRSRRRYGALGQVHSLATRLVATIRDGDLPLDGGLTNHFNFPDSVTEALENVSKIAAAARDERKRLKALGMDDAAPMSNMPGDGSTAGSEFIRHMVGAFETAFLVRAEVVQDSTREPAGPFIAFVLTCLRELEAAGVPKPMADTEAAVAQALIRYRRA